MTVDTGVSPLELRLAPIIDSHTKFPFAYRAETLINSVEFGSLPFSCYQHVADNAEAGIRLARWGIKAAIAAIRRFEAKGRKVDFISVRCPAALAAEVELYEWMSALMREEDFHNPDRLCLEFPLSVLSRPAEKVSLAILNMKLLKVRTMLAGAAGAECPCTRLMDVPFDYVLLDPAITCLADSRDKGTVITMLLQYLRSMHAEIIGEGAQNDTQITVLSRSDCAGYIPAENYQGNLPQVSLSMTVDEAILQREEEEG